jgi:protein TonB
LTAGSALSADRETLRLGTLPGPTLLPWLGLSIALHAAGLVVVAISWANTDAGAIEQPSEAITVEVVESTVLEAMLVEESRETAASPAAAATQEGNPDAAPEQTVEPPRPEPQRDAASINEAAPRTDAPAESERQAAVAPEEAPRTDHGPVAQATEADSHEKSVEDAIVAPNKREEHREPQKTSKKQGGVTTKATAGNAPSGGRASASQGSMLTYAAQVRARIANNKPAGEGSRGTVTIAFGVTTSGGLAYASVTRTSGIVSLDQAALSAVRRAAPFPDPPAGASPAQLRFSIALYFQ